MPRNIKVVSFERSDCVYKYCIEFTESDNSRRRIFKRYNDFKLLYRQLSQLDDNFCKTHLPALPNPYRVNSQATLFHRMQVFSIILSTLDQDIIFHHHPIFNAFLNPAQADNDFRVNL